MVPLPSNKQDSNAHANINGITTQTNKLWLVTRKPVE